MDRALDGRESAGRRGREIARELLDGFGKLRVVHATPDQAPVGCLRRRQLIAEERETQCPRRSDQLRQKPGAARVGDEPDTAERLDEIGRPGSNDQITGKGNICSGPRCDSVDGSNNRHRQRAQREHERRVVLIN